ncbi:transmembrane amino acid transporter protein-domain-containing protein [Zopfochytrium polystomum]|nr:transmembrane amino acid transporter protein-domain-containing protein [Zopfochytrium polystomum]
MLAMPSALASVGLILGSVLIGVSAYASIFGLVLLSHCAQAVGRHSSFFQVSKITYPAAAIWFDLAIAIKCFGVSISYLVIIGDLMPKVMLAIYPTLTGYLLTKEFWITIAIFVVTPFSFAKKLDSLRYTSALALCAVVYLLLIVVGFALFPSSDMPKRPSWSEIRLVRFNSFFTTLPIFVFAFTCHQNIFSIHNELIDNTVPRVGAVVRYSIWTAFSVYQVIGIIGYLTFGNAVASNVIQMYPSGPIITGGQIALAILFLLSYPLQCHPARASLDKVISGGSHEPMSQSRYIIVTSGLLAASYVLACTVKDLSTVLSLVGATGSTAICYILPGILYYRLRENTDLPGSRRWDSMKSGAVGLAAFGIVFMVLSLSMQLSAIFGGSKDGGGGH